MFTVQTKGGQLNRLYGYIKESRARSRLKSHMLEVAKNGDCNCAFCSHPAIRQGILELRKLAEDC